MVPLKGSYPANAIEISSSLSTDSIWSQVEQLFSAHGLSIKEVDRSKGIITTRKTDFIPAYTFENETGQMQEAQAWIVLPKTIVKDKQWKVESIYSQWHLQLSSSPEGITSIKVEPKIECTYYASSFVRNETYGQSTGKFEELLKSSLAGKP